METWLITLTHGKINFGKIYGTMDDLRLEHERVQQKYIAMTRALIESCDIDGFRVDSQMQVRREVLLGQM